MKKRAFSLLLIPFLLFYALPTGAAEKEDRKWEEEIIYSLMIDRFNNGSAENDRDVDVANPEAYNGGDFAGIAEQLDYIKDQGFTAIMLTPVFDNEAGGYHGNWVTDFYATDEHFGTMAEFKQLVKEAHKRDIRIILDFVVDHVGPNHSWVSNPEKQDWFHEKKEVTNWNDPDEVENGWIDGLPDLNQDNPETRDYLIDVAKWWIEETDIDGYHLGTVNTVPKDFWIDFSAAVKSTKDDFYLLGDTLKDDSSVNAEYVSAGIDGLLNSTQNSMMRTTLVKPDQTLSGLFSDLMGKEEAYDNSELFGKFIDNQDLTRFTHEIISNNQNPETRWKLALAYMYTTPEIPIIYYGSEIALNGGEQPDNRKLMGFKAEQQLIEYMTKLSSLRNEYLALSKGKLELLYEEQGVAIFKRIYKDQTMVVAINNTSKTQTFEFAPGDIEKDKELRGVLEGDLIRSIDGKYRLSIDREVAEIYTVTNKTGYNLPYIMIIGAVLVVFAIFILLLIKRAKRNRPIQE